MIAFGYEKDNDEEKLMKLSETTLQCNNEELDRIIDFLNRIKNTNYEAGDHYHYRDFNKKWTSEESDFIIFFRRRCRKFEINIFNSRYVIFDILL